MSAQARKPWQQTASSLLVVDSILAAVSAVVTQAIFSDPRHHSWLWLCLAIATLAFFVLSAEKTAESAVNGELQTFIFHFHFYNIGVYLLFIDLWGMFDHYLSIRIYDFKSIVFFIVASFFWLYGWGCDELSIILKHPPYFERWKNQLNGEAFDGDILDHCQRCRSWVDGLLRSKNGEVR
jgi:hypothetical protein